jgi:hypothetical protein
MTAARLLSIAPLIVTFAAAASAHRLDEYLQATRISVERDRVDLEVDLTPGAAVAEQIVRAIDLDRDGEISLREKEMYAATLISSLSLRVDELSRSMRITDFIVPPIDEMYRGEGVLKLRATASMPRAAAGAHRLKFANAHWPSVGAYLVNALVPTNEEVHITGQSRDLLQREFSLEYTVTDEGAALPLASALPILISLTLAASLYTLARRQSRL